MVVVNIEMLTFLLCVLLVLIFCRGSVIQMLGQIFKAAVAVVLFWVFLVLACLGFALFCIKLLMVLH